MASGSGAQYDVVVIGGGPGGYVAAIRAAQLGGKVACIERQYWGGTCLNVGCIPTKVMIANTERLEMVREAEKFGIKTGEVSFDFAKMMERKNKIVKTQTGGVESLLKKNGVERFFGHGRIAGIEPHVVEVTLKEGDSLALQTRNIIIATGSKVANPPIAGINGEGVWTSDNAVNETTLPKSMVIAGGGYIGCEFAYVYHGLGVDVTIVEMLPHILGGIDQELAVELEKLLKRKGIKILTETKVTEIAGPAGKKTVTVDGAKGQQTLSAEVVLAAIGRAAYFEGLGHESVGVKMDSRKRLIPTDDHMRTNLPGIFAIGDVTGVYPLAHVASHQGLVAAENAMGHEAAMDYRAVPAVVFTEPEVATVGLTEQQAIEQGYEVQVGRYPFRPLGKAMAVGQQDGLIKIVSEKRYGEILGVHILGPHASDLLPEGVLSIALENTIDEWAEVIHTHPTLSEGVGEAVLDALGRVLHK